MKKLTFILISLFIISIANVNAQIIEITLNIVPDSATIANQLNAGKRENGIETYIINNKEQTVLIKYDNTKTNVGSILELFKGFKAMEQKSGKPVIQVSESVVNVSKPIPEKYNTEIDKFLNIEDSCIFTNFIQFDKAQIHPRSRNFYELIIEIHNLDSILSVTSNMKANKFPEIKQNIEKIGQIYDLIKSYAEDKNGRLYYFLSENQKQYYRDLVQSYQVLDNNFNPPNK